MHAHSATLRTSSTRKTTQPRPPSPTPLRPLASSTVRPYSQRMIRTSTYQCSTAVLVVGHTVCGGCKAAWEASSEDAKNVSPLPDLVLHAPSSATLTPILYPPVACSSARPRSLGSSPRSSPSDTTSRLTRVARRRCRTSSRPTFVGRSRPSLPLRRFATIGRRRGLMVFKFTDCES
jgi:hypothetical protein